MDTALVPVVLILAVAAGLVTATVSASWLHSRQTAFYRWFLANILLFNLLILLGLVFHLTRIQLLGSSAFRRTFPLALVALSAYLVYGFGRRFEAALPEAAWPVRLIRSGYLFDAAYRKLAEGLAALAQRLRQTQTGDLNINAAGILAALVIVLVVLLLEVL